MCVKAPLHFSLWQVCGEALFIHSLRALLTCPRSHLSTDPPTATTQLREGMRDSVQPSREHNEHSWCERQKGTMDDSSHCITQRRDWTSKFTRTDSESFEGSPCLANNTASTSTQHDANTKRVASCLVNPGFQRKNPFHAPVSNTKDTSVNEEAIGSSADDSSIKPPTQTQSQSPSPLVRGRKTFPYSPLFSARHRLLDRVVVVVDDVAKVEALLRQAGLEEVEVVQVRNLNLKC